MEGINKISKQDDSLENAQVQILNYFSPILLKKLPQDSLITMKEINNAKDFFVKFSLKL